MNIVVVIKKHWLILLIVVILAIIFFPKDCGFSEGGLIQPGLTLRREECSCLGIKYGNYGDAFGFMKCIDCGKSYFCAGIPTGKTCFERVVSDPPGSSVEKQVEC